MYAIIGGLACQSSAQGVEKIRGADISPQVHPCFLVSLPHKFTDHTAAMACRQSSRPRLLQPGLNVRVDSYCMGCTYLMLPDVVYTPFGPVTQGAFILVGNNSFGYPLLVVMAVGVLIYACWRFWEGITGQGSDDAFGPFKNFFRYRLSPTVSVRHWAFCSALQLPLCHLWVSLSLGQLHLSMRPLVNSCTSHQARSTPRLITVMPFHVFC